MSNALNRNIPPDLGPRNTPCISIMYLPHGVGLELPSYETSFAAGADIRAAIEADVSLAPGARIIIPTGFAMALPQGWEAQIRPRSGLAAKHGITCLNSPGTIDADYRGEVKVLLINLGMTDFSIKHGDRIAQMVIAPAYQAQFLATDSLEKTARGVGGFGSTGVST